MSQLFLCNPARLRLPRKREAESTDAPTRSAPCYLQAGGRRRSQDGHPSVAPRPAGPSLGINSDLSPSSTHLLGLINYRIHICRKAHSVEQKLRGHNCTCRRVLHGDKALVLSPATSPRYVIHEREYNVVDVITATDDNANARMRNPEGE